MKLLGSTKSKMSKNENSENVPHLKNTEVVLVHCIVDIDIDYQQYSRVLYMFVPNKSFSQLLIVHLIILYLDPQL